MAPAPTYGSVPKSTAASPTSDMPAKVEAAKAQWRRILPVTFAVLALTGAAFVTRSSGKQSSATSFAQASSKLAQPELLSDNDHTRRTGRTIGDGLYDHHIVDVHRATRFQLASQAACKWAVDGVSLTDSPAVMAETTFDRIGEHTVTAETRDGAVYEYLVFVKSVRYELRDLSEEDREAYLAALHQLYFISQEEGEAKYGADFYSSDKLVKIHLEGAASKQCDHWHDDAGILNHHVGITAKFEQSLRMIAPKTAAHYWDYTREASEVSSWTQSEIFHADWFGDNSPNHHDHVVFQGRFAYTPVMQHARGFSNVTNPYGLMRSPWNTNPVPYLMRYNHTMDVYADDNTEFPTCAEFGEYVGQSLNIILEALNGVLHGPVHIMIGGQWHEKDSKWHKVTDTMDFPDSFLLLAKVLWRAGYLREPSFCSSDTPAEECLTKCPEELSMGWNATEFLNNTGIIDLMPSYIKTSLTMNELNLTNEDLKNELCHVGFPGEMFTSAAPQDPTFWPLHGNAERFVQLLRILDVQGKVTFNQTWGYGFADVDSPSSDGLVCDWSGVDDQTMKMPTCEHQVCPGHAADDNLPFTGLFTDQTRLYTNAEYYNLISPLNTKLPYAYDALDYWKGCKNSSMYSEFSDHLRRN